MRQYAKHGHRWSRSTVPSVARNTEASLDVRKIAAFAFPRVVTWWIAPG
jgi:hypothetical protein